MNFSYFGFYASGAVLFVFVIGCGEFLFSLNFKRKSKFALRFVAAYLVIVAIAVLLALLSYYLDYYFRVGTIVSNVYSLLMYSALFVVTVAAMKTCYNESLIRCLSTAVTGYLCQHISYGVFSVINLPLGLENLLLSELGMNGYWLSLLLQIMCAAVILTAVYFSLVKKVRMFSSDGIIKRNVLFLIITSLSVVLIMNCVGNIVADGDVAVGVYIRVFSILACVFMIFIYTNTLERKETEKELDTVMQLNRLEHKHYTELKSNMDLISIKCHDIKHFIALAGKDKGIDLSELSDCVDIYDTTVKTGNEVIDTLIAERALYCSANDIKLNVAADAEQLDYISVTDMCALFGNMLENAIEAVEKIDDKDARIVNITVRPIAGQVSFCVENSYTDDLDTVNGLPISSKGDTDRHGFGMRSIRLIAEKYDGVFSYSAKDGVFRVNILFPIKNRQ